MNILIIGNGFDLAHGLPTTYNDFLLSVKGYRENYSEAFFKEYELNKYKTDFLMKNKDDLFKNYQEYERNHFGKLTENGENDEKEKRDKIMHREIRLKLSNFIWFDYFIQLKDKGDKWIDLEEEMRKVIEKLDFLFKKILNSYKYNHFTSPGNEKDLPELEDDKDNYIKNLMDFYDLNRREDEIVLKVENVEEYIKLIIEYLLNSLDFFIGFMNIYMKIINTIQIEGTLIDLRNKTFDRILSFNYTTIFEDFYYRGADNKNIHYAHGNIKNNNLIFGINDYIKAEGKDTDLMFVRFKKYFQRIHKRTGERYQRWLDEKKENTVHIFGHSLGSTDGEILKHFLNDEKSKITIYYHSEDSFLEKIENLIKIIGPEKTVALTGGKKPRIFFKQQLKLKV